MNLSMTNSSIREGIDRPLVAGVYTTIFLVGFTSNLVTLALITCVRSLRTISTIPIVNLCLAGFLDILVLPFIITFNIMNTWPFGHVICKLVLTSESVSKHATICFAALASVERYFGVCHADIWREKWTRKLACVLTLAAWFISVLFASPIAIYSGAFIHELGGKNRARCAVAMPYPKAEGDVPFDLQYAVCTFAILYILPTTIIVFSYVKICHKLKTIAMRLDDQSTQSVQSNRRRPNHGSVVRHRRVTKTILIIIAFFLICWSPYWMMNMLKVVNSRFLRSTNSVRVILNGLHMLPFINCAVNPLLYGLLSGNFRAAMTDIWGRRAELFCCADPHANQSLALTSFSKRKTVEERNRPSTAYSQSLVSPVKETEFLSKCEETGELQAVVDDKTLALITKSD